MHNPNDANYCGNCGNKLGTAKSRQRKVDEQERENEEKTYTSWSAGKWALVLLVVIGLFVGCYFLFCTQGGDELGWTKAEIKQEAKIRMREQHNWDINGFSSVDASTAEFSNMNVWLWGKGRDTVSNEKYHEYFVNGTANVQNVNGAYLPPYYFVIVIHAYDDGYYRVHQVDIEKKNIG